jgi:hypothetical protein
MRGSEGNKVLGGCGWMARDDKTTFDEAAEELCRRFPMMVTDSGRVSFEHYGKQVRLYMSVDPELSEKGRKLLAEYRARKAEEAEEERLRAEAEEEILDDVISWFGRAEATAILQAARKAGRK